MNDGSSFVDMATNREREAEQLSEHEIFTNIIVNLVNQNMQIKIITEMLMQTIEDKQLISTIIKESMKNGKITKQNGKAILTEMNK